MIGVFDSGFGGLVVLREFLAILPQYDYLYLGDNARIPYGTRSDSVVYRLTEQAVDYLFRQGCQLIILACHTATAKALRSLQQAYLPQHYPERRILGVLVPTVEEAVSRSPRKRIGIIATEGTVSSRAFEREIFKLDPLVQVFQQVCPLLVPLIEEGELDWEGTAMILRRYLAPLQSAAVDTLILGCTHYSILKEQVKAILGTGIELVCSGQVSAVKLIDYLARHPEIERLITRGGRRRFLTTDLTPRFQRLATLFMDQPVDSEVVDL